MKADAIRSRYLAYFAERGHTVVPSSSLVPAGDPTLLFTNSGMVQFKDVFLGREQRPYRRAVSAQKCVRAGGKHNDLEAVGRTARHHTFFEMLGNWSFGDYFKEEAIAMAWEFVRRGLGLDEGPLWVTVHEADPESRRLWRKIAGLPEDRIVALGDHDNFWQMAETGPCGPDTELFFDRGDHLACGPDCGIGRCDCDRWLEIWNLVFMVYDRDSAGHLSPLPQTAVDTGMGLERIASVLQGVASNYDTDLFTPILAAIADAAGTPYLPGPEGFPMRVLADHARSATFLIADGVLPSNEGRGYVLRRIIRRAVRIGRPLGDGGRLARLVPVVVSLMQGAYPELGEGAGLIEAAVAAEEERFLATLDSGNRRLEEVLARSATTGVVDGAEAFTLYDTYGFPFDLTEEVTRERGLRVDRAGFERAMAEQRRRARVAQRTAGGGLAAAVAELPPTTFVGYETLESVARVRLLWQDGPQAALGAGEEGFVVLEPTPFYAEGGGQVGDRGALSAVDVRAEVLDTQKADGRHYSRVRVVSGVLTTGSEVLAEVDRELREGAMRNHTGTHVLHQALREILGDQVRQTGSLVAPDRLRFDFAAPRPPTEAELQAVEELANRVILSDVPVAVEYLPMAEARRRGALMFFDEKYGDTVRLVQVGDFSTELCGGTHCQRSGQIGMLRILSEGGIGSGMRRLEAATGLGALQQWRVQDAQRRRVARTVGAARPEDAEAKARDLAGRLEEVARERDRLLQRSLAQDVATVWAGAEPLAGHRLAVGTLAEADAARLRLAVDAWRAASPSGVLVLGGRSGGWSGFVVAVSADLTAVVDAARVCRVAAAAAGGKGGGRRDLAQGGVADAAGLERALATARAEVAAALSAVAPAG